MISGLGWADCEGYREPAQDMEPFWDSWGESGLQAESLSVAVQNDDISHGPGLKLQMSIPAVWAVALCHLRSHALHL